MRASSWTASSGRKRGALSSGDAMQKPSWRIRRRIIIGTLLFCGGEIVYLTVWGADTNLHSTIASGVLILAGSVIGSYVFGAAWDDKNWMGLGKKGDE